MQPPSNSNPNRFDLDRIKSDTGLLQVEYSSSLPSTNDRAIKIAKSVPDALLPQIVLTSIQSHGRGQNGHRWFAGEGSLTFSIVAVLGNDDEVSKLIPASVAVAICEAIEETALLSDAKIIAKIKWPNDIIVENGKAGGILIESVVPKGNTNATRVVIGIGLNVNNAIDPGLVDPVGEKSAAIFPPISLIEVTHHAIALNELCINIVNKVISGLRHPQSTVDQYNARSFLTGKTVSVQLPDNTIIRGRAKGISNCGGLQVSPASANGDNTQIMTIVSGRIDCVSQ